MNEQMVFVLWAVKHDNISILPGCFDVGPVALFWAEIFAQHTQSDVVVDVVPATGYRDHERRMLWAAEVSEEAFHNASGLLEDFCFRTGGLTEAGGGRDWHGLNRVKFQS